METGSLKKFARSARRQLMEQVKAKLDQILTTDSVEVREKAEAITALKKQINKTSRQDVIRKAAYTWFNRFCALRFMDVNRYTPIGVTAAAEGFTQPEILQEAKQGHIDKRLDRFLDRQRIFDLLDGRTPSSDPQQEAYHLLLVAECNYWHAIMPFLFERIADYTELLMPSDLLSENSVLVLTKKALTAESCQDVEVIGWLYQFYISEKKDEVFTALKKGKKIAPENIPAATQLFTPHWIVRYLVENSLGRLWMLNRPNSRLKERMDYYIEPEQPETGFLKISSPEELKICDPACGSGHMLVYAFDLLYAIYEEEGYDPPGIPRFILENNLYGIEIDERAGELAAFALVMKAREKYKRFFAKPVQPQICVLENIVFKDGELKPYMDEIGRDLFTINFKDTLHQFREADNFGSLIRPALTDVAYIRRALEEKDVGGNIFLYQTHEKVLRVLKQADFLCPKYHVVVANPPYMGGKGMNGRLGAWAKANYPSSKSDLFAMFIERNLELALKQGSVAMITMQSWMFLSSFEKLRNRLLGKNTILSMAHLGARAFDSIGGEVVSTTAFVLENSSHLDYKGGYIRLVDCHSESEKEDAIREAVMNPDCSWLYRTSAADFEKIPGRPIAYWVSDAMRMCFMKMSLLSDVGKATLGMNSTNNDLFVRRWFEIAHEDIDFDAKSEESSASQGKKWFPYNKGGDFRKWYGNRDFVINWKNNGVDIHKYNNIPLTYRGAPVRSKQYQFKESATWSFITSSKFGVRYSPAGSMFDVAGSSYFAKMIPIKVIVGFLCSKVAFKMLNAINPTLNFQVGNISSLPIADHLSNIVFGGVNQLIALSKSDLDTFDTSWTFSAYSLLHPDHHQLTLNSTYSLLRAHWHEMTLQTQHLEQKNNCIFIEAYGLQNELNPEVPLDEITLTCNPHYRYNGNKSEAELEALLLDDTMREFISYAVGCMFGRYALDKPGLILANRGETIEDYLNQIPDPTFPADKDNVIPILDGDWFSDDITERFRTFLRVTFGDKHYEENLAFIETAIGKDIRKFFLKDFYADHLKRYKKRPIYWLFASPKGTFNALIYMHRYRPDTVSVILNDYLREFKTKLSASKDHLEQISISASATQAEKTKAIKEIEKLKKILDEIEAWEREVLYPLASRRIEIDLDDGVKVNYNKFGNALKKVPGLSM
jgi:type II restriction/modification system DNA methylase subunit YeeA